MERRATLIALVVGTAIRCLAPVRLVMIYKGYALTTAAADLVAVPRYGAGALVLHRTVLGTFGVDHLHLIALHTVLGVFAMVSLIALLIRLRPTLGAVSIAAWLLALTPLLIKDHRTESLLVVSCALLWPGCLLWDIWRSHRRTLDGVGAVTLLSLAAVTRPELLLVVPLMVAGVTWLRGPPARRNRMSLLVAAAVFALLVLPHALHIVQATQEQAASGALPSMAPSLLSRLARGGVFYGAIFEPSLFPIAATIMAAVAMVLRPPAASERGRALPLMLMGVALVWMVVVRVDMPVTSIPRLHAPAAALTCLAAAIGAVTLWHHPRLPGKAGGRARLLIVGLLLLATALPTVMPHWRTTNEDEEERFLRQVFERLPAEPVCLLRLDGDDDPAPGKVHRDFPDYLAVPPMRQDHLSGLRAWQNNPEGACPGGVYLVHGLRCYARADGQRPDGGARERDDTGPIRACADLLKGHAWRPVFEYEVANHGDNEFGYYPDEPTFRLGLYRLDQPAAKM